MDNINLLKNLDLKKLDTSIHLNMAPLNLNPPTDIMKSYSAIMDESNQKRRKRESLQDEANRTTIENKEILMEIAENTSYLKKIVEINRETQLNTEELNHVMRAIYDVSKASSKEEADGLFKKALTIINDSGEFAGNVANLVSLLSGIHAVVNTMN